jgi:hypothetical protein
MSSMHSADMRFVETEEPWARVYDFTPNLRLLNKILASAIVLSDSVFARTAFLEDINDASNCLVFLQRAIDREFPSE